MAPDVARGYLRGMISDEEILRDINAQSHALDLEWEELARTPMTQKRREREAATLRRLADQLSEYAHRMGYTKGPYGKGFH
jgi:hypothetical protein